MIRTFRNENDFKFYIFLVERERVVIVSGNSDNSMSRYTVAEVEADEIFLP